jgi:hypothetical protein
VGQESALLPFSLAFAAGAMWHMGRPDLNAPEAAIFVASLAIVWLGVSIAH